MAKKESRRLKKVCYYMANLLQSAKGMSPEPEVLDGVSEEPRDMDPGAMPGSIAPTVKGGAYHLEENMLDSAFFVSAKMEGRTRRRHRHRNRKVRSRRCRYLRFEVNCSGRGTNSPLSKQVMEQVASIWDTPVMKTSSTPRWK